MTSHAAPRPSFLSPRSILILGGALAASYGAAWLGSAATTPNLAPWYESLAKPWFTPPNAAFPIAWTILFALMAVAVWRVAIVGEGRPLRLALTAFAVQLALNIGWSYAFFAAQNPLLGLIEIVALLAAIVWTIARFRPIDRLAAALLYPYVVWVAFAGLLNASILYLNG